MKVMNSLFAPWGKSRSSKPQWPGHAQTMQMIRLIAYQDQGLIQVVIQQGKRVGTSC